MAANCQESKVERVWVRSSVAFGFLLQLINGGELLLARAKQDKHAVGMTPAMTSPGQQRGCLGGDLGTYLEALGDSIVFAKDHFFIILLWHFRKYVFLAF